MSASNIGIVIHGGAGTILKSQLTTEKEEAYIEALQIARDKGFDILANGGTSLTAVEVAVTSLEDCPLFNAGKGSVYNHRGQHEMDASIMDGKLLHAGAVAAVRNLKNPIQLAHKVLLHSDHVLLIGEGAAEFGLQQKSVFETDEYFYDQYRYDQWQKVKDTDKFQLDHSREEKKYFGTVGAVALDVGGNLCAGTSTGGMTNKKFGRVGDSPIIGVGNYANNSTCAVSCTGSGEYFMRAVSAYDVSCLMEYKNMTLAEASTKVIQEKLVSIGGDGGLIAIDTQGNMAMPFNCDGMYRASRNSENAFVAIFK